MTSLADAEAILCASYQEQAELYQQALELLAAVPAQWQEEFDLPGCLEQIAGLLGEIGQVDSRIAGLRQSWQEGSRPAPPALRSILDRIAQTIQSLLEHVGRAALLTQQQREQLLPTLDALCRTQQMRRAYGQTRSDYPGERGASTSG